MATCSLLVKSQLWNVTPTREGLEACVEAGACGVPLLKSEDCLKRQIVCVRTCSRLGNHQFQTVCPCNPWILERLEVTSPLETSSSVWHC